MKYVKVLRCTTAVFLSVAVVAAFGDRSAVATGSEWVLEAESLADAAQMFSVRHQVLTTYEDSVLRFRGDLQDVSSRAYRASDVRGAAKFQPLYVNRLLKLTLKYHLATNNTSAEDITQALRQIIEAYNAGENPGKFRVEPKPPVWHIIPTEARDEKGEWQKETPLLDRVVEAQSGRAHLYDYIFSVMRPAISNTPFVKFGFNRNPIGSEPPDIEVAGGALSLRDLLTDIFISNFDGIFWQTMCGPTEQPGKMMGLYLNLYQIEPKTNAPRPSRAIEASHTKVEKPHTLSRKSLITPKQDAADPVLFHVDVTGERPLADALEGFMRLHQVLVTYEDPLYEFAGDLDDQTMMRKDLAKYPPGQAPRVLQPKRMQFQAQYLLDTGKKAPGDITAALEQLIEQYNNGPRIAEFKLSEGPGIWHVVPTRVRDNSGSWKAATSILNNVVHLTGGETNYMEFTSSSLQEACRDIGIRLWEFTALPPQIVTLPEGDFTLREMLARLITSNFVNVTWFMLCDPTPYPRGGIAFNYFRLPSEPLDLFVPHLLQLNGSNWKAEVTDCPVPVVVAFLSEGLKDIHVFAATLDELNLELVGRVKIAMVDMVEQYDVASEFGVRTMPTLLLFKGGVVQQELLGIVSKAELMSWIESALK
ncbi:MAG: thioredoxin family protein [Verrucomicrobia bacterium]|nr:thioredoxin family protein [Verrucomicrobiota bacterium]